MSEPNSNDLIATPEELTDADLEQVAGGKHAIAEVQHVSPNVQHINANVQHATASVHGLDINK